MDEMAKFSQVDRSNELYVKQQYDRISQAGTSGYCLVSLALKNFMEYSRPLGGEKSEEALVYCFHLLQNCLGEGELIVRMHSWYFNLLVKCEAIEEALHPKVAAFHFAVRDGLQEKYGEPMYLEMGFYPMTKPRVDYFQARYYADLCRIECPHNEYAETSYDMYGVSFYDQKEEYQAYGKLAKKALPRGDFKLYLQPKVDLKTGEVRAAEALMRWIDPERGMLPLPVFLPVLEENGFIRDVDLYLFDDACGYLDKWFNQNGHEINISFNMSRAYFNGPFFVPDYTAIFEKHKVPPRCVRIEFIEGIVLNEMDKLLPMVRQLYDYGFSCALDDFGSGFSSFDIITNVQLSEMKIDRSLFQNVENPRERLLIKHLVEIAHDLNMVTVAEGVETEAYDRYLKEIGCDYIQGFYYYKPMPVEEFEQRFILNTSKTK